MTDVWSGARWTLRRGDVLRLVLEMLDESVDGVVTDCPYSSGGMTRGDRTVATTAKYMNSDSAFAGAGSTGAAALRAGRRALLFELSPEIAETAARRLEAEEAGLDLTAFDAGQLALLGSSEEAGV